MLESVIFNFHDTENYGLDTSLDCFGVIFAPLTPTSLGPLGAERQLNRHV